MVETLLEHRRFATIHIVHGATRNQPHDQLNAFAASFTHIFDVRNIGSGLRIVDELFHENTVKLFIDKPRTRTLKLVTHATGAPDVNVDIFVVSFNGFANGFAQIVSMLTSWDGVLHDVHSKWDDRTWPFKIVCRWLATHQ